MSITSFVFFLFIFVALIIYYIVPKQFQWTVLLVTSLIFYLSGGAKSILYVMITSVTIHFAALWINSISIKQKLYFKENKGNLLKEEKERVKEKNKRIKKRILTSTLILNFGILCFFKYFHFVLEQLNAVIDALGGNIFENNISFVVPLGISFYTFQATGYLIDVYWGNCEPQKNYWKTLLFVSFFPQVTQGPISEYHQLSKELYEKHSFTCSNYAQGFQRMLWGFFKKMVVADGLAPMVSDLFGNYSSYAGITCLIGAFCYSVQIYADFSGYMDIMCGICKMFGITLTENFERPYFSKSIAEYWRRWHITLGAWFKKFIYYPIGMSKWNQNVGKTCSKKFGKHVGKNMPASIALVVVWLTTGLWHGASWAYIAWGGVNGLFIIFSMWMEPTYAAVKQKLHINENSALWKFFQIIRTFILVTFIKVLPEVGTLSDGLGLWKRIFTNYRIPASFGEMLPFVNDKLYFLIIIFGIILMFAVSVLQRKQSVIGLFNRMPMLVRHGCMTIILLLIVIFGVANGGAGGFMYVQF